MMHLPLREFETPEEIAKDGIIENIKKKAAIGQLCYLFKS
jgi:hypothetical protein